MIFVGLAHLFGTRLLETRSCLYVLSIALCPNSFSKHECRLSNFLLERIVSIERLMARRIRLEVAYVGIQFSLGTSRYQVHVPRPVHHYAPQCLRSTRVAM